MFNAGHVLSLSVAWFFLKELILESQYRQKRNDLLVLDALFCETVIIRYSDVMKHNNYYVRST